MCSVLCQFFLRERTRNVVRMSPCMLIAHKDHTYTHMYSVTVMTHVIALEARQSSQGTSEPITPVCKQDKY